MTALPSFVCPIESVKLEAIFVRVVSLDFDQFGHNTAAVTAFDLQQQVNGIGDTAPDRLKWELHVGLENAARQASDGLPGVVSVNGRERPRVTCVERLKEVEGLRTTHLAQQDTVGPVTKRGLN
jgi:hypothetical protein